MIAIDTNTNSFWAFVFDDLGWVRVITNNLAYIPLQQKYGDK